MDKINELQDKIQNLQTQINATQAQINDYKTNPKYYTTALECLNCGWLLGSNARCKSPMCIPLPKRIRDVTYFTKVRELANAESSLNSLQNQLKSTQDALDSLLQDKQAQIKPRTRKQNAKSIPPNANYKQYKHFARDKFFAKHFSPRHQKPHKPQQKRVILGFF